MLVGDILKMKGGDVQSIGPQAAVRDAAARMISLDIGSLLVLDDAGRLVGIITHQDVLRTLVGRDFQLGVATVAEAMTAQPQTVGPDATVDFLRGLMTGNHFSHVPVVEGGRIVGVVSFYDVARSALKAANFENALLKRYIRNWPEEE